MREGGEEVTFLRKLRVEFETKPQEGASLILGRGNASVKPLGTSKERNPENLKQTE